MTLIDFENIQKAKDTICDEVLNQIKNGKQSKDFADVDAYACGQFLKVPDKNQHGFHGTSAAIRVLAEYPERYNEELRKLIKYFDVIETADIEGKTINGLRKDNTNIIKNAEILYTLSHIQSGTCNTEELKKTIYEKLKEAKNIDGGWAFFIDVKDESDIFSTSLVYLALKSHNFNNLTDTLTFIKDKIREYIKLGIPDPTSFSKLCFAVYSLTKLKYHKIDNGIRKLLIDANKNLWKSEYCVLNSEYEQNIEYPSMNRHHYVRIPWQLYLLSIANDLSPRYFAKRQSINRLNSILNAIINNGGFVYKHSGKNISSRTYSIIFEILSNIQNTFDADYKFKIFSFIDLIRNILGSKTFKVITTIIGFIIIIILVIHWIRSDTFDITSVAPSIIASLLIISISLGKSK